MATVSIAAIEKNQGPLYRRLPERYKSQIRPISAFLIRFLTDAVLISAFPGRFLTGAARFGPALALGVRIGLRV
jgi:hypothetical protein